MHADCQYPQSSSDALSPLPENQVFFFLQSDGAGACSL